MAKKASKAKKTKAARKARSGRRTPKPVVIDFHAHILCEEVFAATYPLTVIGQRRAEGGGVIHALPDEQRRRMVDLDQRLKDMDAMGVDIQVISPSILHQCTYSLDPQEAVRLERIVNDDVAETVAKKPDRLIGLGCVPLQDSGVAIKEMERCVRDLGLKGIIVGSRVNDWELGDKNLWPFWKRAAELGVALFMHPAGNADPRLRKHTMLISLGQPLEEAFAMASLVYEGVMDAFPKLKIAFAHGGGFIPFYAGRFDWMYRRGGTKDMKGDFSGYLKKFYYESVLFNPDMLERLAEKTDTSHIMLGSDYPFGEWKPIQFVGRAKAISEAKRRAILGANAAKFLNVNI